MESPQKYNSMYHYSSIRRKRSSEEGRFGMNILILFRTLSPQFAICNLLKYDLLWKTIETILQCIFVLQLQGEGPKMHKNFMHPEFQSVIQKS